MRLILNCYGIASPEPSILRVGYRVYPETFHGTFDKKRERLPPL